ncbi:hypothetical protein GCM10023322_52740 [Rugosimonospora acidiphila]|uniref:Uncharacterized protein n=1 Tax=Rugosimonospora acidiphila TaxID=556531 RepID=A0ABP9S9U2_9ACTN
MVNPTLEMRRLAGKFAFFFAGVYVLVLFGAVVSETSGAPLPLLGWPLLLLPAAAFVISVIDAVRLHRTTDADVMRSLWRRCMLYTAIGMVLLVASALAVERMTLA